MKDMAEKADKQSPAEQERVSRDLAKQIQDEQDPMIRRYIVMTLGHYKTAAATAVLQAAVSDADSTGATLPPAKPGDAAAGQKAAERLASLLASDTNLDVRLAAARAIGQTKEKSAVPPLAEASPTPIRQSNIPSSAL